MKAFYHSAIIGECVDVQFKNSYTLIKLSPQYVREGLCVIACGWEVTVQQQNNCNQVWSVPTMILEAFTILFFQVTTAAVEQYTGEGEPPYCEMTLRAADDNTTRNGNFTVVLNGAQPPKNIKIMRKLESDDVPANPAPDSVGM